MRVAQLWVFESKMGGRDPFTGAGMGSRNLNELWAHAAGSSAQARGLSHSGWGGLA